MRHPQLTRVGVGNLGNLVRVEPNLALSALQDGGGQTFLTVQRNPVGGIKKSESGCDRGSVTLLLRLLLGFLFLVVVL